MAQGDGRGAIRKFRAAADHAPQWGALHLAWGRALEADGKRDDAREKYTGGRPHGPVRRRQHRGGATAGGSQ